MGRELQKAYGKPQQSILTMPILEGLDGVQKMSKSLNNYIGVNDSANEMFGKIMSVSDELMWRYFELLSFRPLDEIAEFKSQIDNGGNPRDIKFKLAQELISRFHSEQAATDAQNDFINRFSKNAIPDDMPEVELTDGGEGIVLANILKDAGLVSSTSEAHRMVKQGAVKIDGERVGDSRQILQSGFMAVMQVGKRKFARIKIQ